MNSFANSLFSLLFGWARTLIQSIWTAVVSGHFSGFFTWLGDHWLGLVLFLCVLCTAMDFLIWIVRWRPYLVWRTKFRTLRRWITGEARASAREFAKGYQDGVGLEPADEAAEEAPPAGDSWAEADWSEPAPPSGWAPDPAPAYVPAWSAPQAAEPGYAPAAYQDIAYETAVPQAAGEPLPEDGAYQEDGSRQRMFVPASGYELPPIAPSTRVNSSFASDMPAARRRRRSEKYEKRKPAWRQKLIRDDDDEDRLLDGLPPAVDRDQAFYEPVYPQAQAGEGYYGWQRANYPNQSDGNQA